MTSDSITDAQITSYMRGIDAIADTAHDKLVYLAGTTTGTTVTVLLERLSAAEKLVRQLADDGGHVLTAGKILCEAVRRWNQAHPDDATLSAAKAAVDNSEKAVDAAMDNLVTVMASSLDDTAAQEALRQAEAGLKTARKQLADVIERRERADKELQKACAPAMDHLRPVKGKNEKTEGGDHGKRTPGPGTAPQAKPAPGSAVPVKPSVAAPATSTSDSGVSSASGSVQDKSLRDFLVRTGQLRPQQEMQSANQTPFQQQPQVAPAAASAAPAPSASTRPDSRNSADDAIKSSDVPDIPIAVGVNPSPATNSSASGTSTAQHTPATSGTSAKELHTDANVTGRPEGPRTFASGATSKLTNTTGFNGGTQPQTAAAHAGMGQPVAAPMGAGASAGTSKSSAKIQSAQSKLDYEEGVVPGGTIAQNRPDEGGGK